jgi:protein tyrosine/serine phosphatase
MTSTLKVALGALIAAVLIAGPLTFACRQQSQARNFRVVCPGVLYRSGQLSRPALQRVLFDYGIRTVISLRDGQTRSDQEEEELCNGEEVNFVRILPSRWGDEGGSIPVESGVKKFREVMSDPRNHPVLIHCYAGIHRSGAFTAIYRMEFEHWTNEEAMAEMRACGYTTLDHEGDIHSFLENYRPAWMKEGPAAPQDKLASE